MAASTPPGPTGSSPSTFSHSTFLAEAWAKEHGLSTDMFDLAYEVAREPMAYESSSAENERERHALFLHPGRDTRMHEGARRRHRDRHR